MIDKVSVEFCTHDKSDVPVIGSRKKVLVNGKPQMMYVARVEVSFHKDYDFTYPCPREGRVIQEFAGTVVYKRARAIFR